MGWSKTCNQHNLRHHLEIFLAKHHLSLRVPQQITVDNAKYFYSAMFKDFCHQVRMKVSFTSVYQPQSNRAVERANTLIFEAMKKILKGEKNGKWAVVMPRAVRSHNTTVSRATNFTPFCLLFRAEAVLPKEIKHQSLHTTAEAPPCPSEANQKDLLESERHKVVTNLQKYQDEARLEGPKGQEKGFQHG
jgi:transposase InsO family protein